MKFYLGTHISSWLEFLDIPLFVSRRRLSSKKLPRALGRWVLDSGGFSELSMHGAWSITREQYVHEVMRYEQDIGGLDWVAPMDWMCEPPLLKKTGLSVEEHQQRTIDSFLFLRDSPIWRLVAPVLQGWVLDDYLRHVEMYEQHGVFLEAEPVVGVGSVCRRQHTGEAVEIFARLASLGLKLHGFGVKTRGLRQAVSSLVSADSMAWSFNARRQPRAQGCSHKSCANCDRYALRWRGRLLQELRGVKLVHPSQMEDVPWWLHGPC